MGAKGRRRAGADVDVNDAHCDGDAVLSSRRPARRGVSYGTAQRFYLSVTPDGLSKNAAPQIVPEKLYPKA